MCVDDYQERLPGAVRPRACRRFVIEDQEEMSRTFYVNISQFEEENQEVALCKILIYLGEKGLVLTNKKFYMPKFKSIVQPYTFCHIKFQALNEPVIILKSYCKSKDNNEIFLENEQSEKDKQEHSPVPMLTACYLRFEMVEQNNHLGASSNANQMEVEEAHEECECMVSSEDASGNTDKLSITSERSLILEKQNKSFIQLDNLHPHPASDGQIGNEMKGSDEISPIGAIAKRTREPERVIGQVVYLVKVWRELHERKKWSLIQAAKLIGISKKSLDDYYLVLRVGEIQGYDFAGNLSHRMGELRNFLRSKPRKISGKLKNPFQSFSLIGELDLDHIIQQFTKGNKFQIPL